MNTTKEFYKYDGNSNRVSIHITETLEGCTLTEVYRDYVCSDIGLLERVTTTTRKIRLTVGEIDKWKASDNAYIFS